MAGISAQSGGAAQLPIVSAQYPYSLEDTRTRGTADHVGDHDIAGRRRVDDPARLLLLGGHGRALGALEADLGSSAQRAGEPLLGGGRRLLAGAEKGHDGGRKRLSVIQRRHIFPKPFGPNPIGLFLVGACT